ncbi:hypothetical protein ACFO9Q_07455 [Paenibacillus sp. GCM10023252]|uniref:hypothetical protein n=1 Tax=Paenibacillus sp. GCM10023252 TaxID=3252649 RepID=UPI00361FCAD8
MNQKQKKGSLILIAGLTALSALTACTKDSATSITPEPSGSEETGLIDYSKAKDSSDLPDWKGKQLTLKLWSAHGTGNIVKKASPKDVVTPEIKRVTGVEIDFQSSFDNNGESIDAKIAKIVASKDYPDIASGLSPDVITKLAQQGTIYDLTDLVPKYAPDVVKGLPKDKLPGLWEATVVTAGQPGKIYALPMNFSGQWTTTVYPDVKNIQNLAAIPGKYPSISVRDDILKKIYPNALTKNEQEALLAKTPDGNIPREVIFDVPIKSPEDFYTFLKKIKDLNVMEDGKPVAPTYIAEGGDNWNLQQLSARLFGRAEGPGPDTNYFNYFDMRTKKMEWMFKQPSFRDEMKYWNKIVRENLAAKESLIDNGSVFRQKLDQGLYAVTYVNNPNEATLKSNGKEFRYRKVYLDIDPQKNKDKYLYPTGSASGGSGAYAIFKDKVKEEDLPQILQYLNYYWTEAGMKATAWGPRSSGLWTEENGVRKFTNPEMQEALVNIKSLPTNYALEYNLDRLTGDVWPRPSNVYANIYLPRMTRTTITSTQTDQYFNPALKAPAVRTPSMDTLFTFFNELDSIKKFQAKRTAFEQALTKVHTAANDTEFDKFFSDFLKMAEDVGLTDQTLQEMDKYYREVLNKEYMSNIK